MYYLLEDNSFQEPRPYRTRSLVEDFGLQPSDWIEGNIMEMPAEPIRIELWERAGNGLSEIFLDSIPLFCNDLIDAFKKAGVDNLQTCSAVLIPPNGKPNTNYKAVNIIGKIACADKKRSQYNDITGTGMIACDFRKLVIDESKTYGQLFFRLAESIDSIIVHERVKIAVDKMNFKYLNWRALN